MQWKREKYGGIQSIRVPPSQVWTPDVRIRFVNKKNKQTTKISSFRSFYSTMQMGNMKRHSNLMSLSIITAI